MKKIKRILQSAFILYALSVNQNILAQDWSLTGNTGTSPSTDFIGTTDAKPLLFKTGGSSSSFERMRILSTGNIGIGLTNPNSRLHILSSTTAGLTDAGMLTIGKIQSNNLVFDGDEIQARNNSNANGLYLNRSGGAIYLGQNPINPGSPILHVGAANGNVGIGSIANSNYRLYVNGSTASTNPVIYSNVSYNGTPDDVVAVEGVSTSVDAYGMGIKGVGGYRGVWGIGNGGGGRNCHGVFGNASGSTNANYGLYGTASGSSSTNYGVYGEASGGDENWGGYFPTKVFANKLVVGNQYAIASGYDISVDGKIICEELKVQKSNDWPDYVFSSDYKLMSITEFEKSIRENGHLPGIPSASEIEQNGINIGDMQARMMEKIEEISLYVIELKKQKETLEKRLSALENKSTHQ